MVHSLLSVEHLRVELETAGKRVPIVDDLSFRLNPAECLGIVGESGCGKSMTALALIGLLPPVARITGGHIFFDGQDMSRFSLSQLSETRGNDISMIFQEPMTSMNPVYTIGEQLSEVARKHRSLSAATAKERAVEFLDMVHLPNPREKFYAYPHTLSGGQLQRVMIAMSLICEPKLLIADEPTTALDVTVQGEIFDLLKELQERFATSILFISHDMEAVAEIADVVMVMYAGRKCEQGSTHNLLRNPAHPYTRGLLSCVPNFNDNYEDKSNILGEIPGVLPSVGELGKNACLYADRCPLADEICQNQTPTEHTYETEKNTHSVVCWKAR